MKFIIPYQIVWYSYVSGTGERNVGNEEVGRVGEVGTQGGWGTGQGKGTWEIREWKE